MPTIYTNQERISKAIDLQLVDWDYSCLKFGPSFIKHKMYYVNELKYQYAEYTDAHPEDGFNHLTEAGVWKNMSHEQKQSYRLEMLYYFWLANQEM